MVLLDEGFEFIRLLGAWFNDFNTHRQNVFDTAGDLRRVMYLQIYDISSAGLSTFFWVLGKQIRSLAFNLRNISLQEISFELPLWSHQFQMRQSSLESLVRPQVGLLAINSLISAISTSVMVGLENICLFIRV